MTINKERDKARYETAYLSDVLRNGSRDWLEAYNRLRISGRDFPPSRNGLQKGYS